MDSLKIVCDNLLEYKKKNPETSFLIITHYSMILDYLRPDYVHILAGKKIVKTGDYHLVHDVEKNGYAKYFSSDEESVLL